MRKIFLLLAMSGTLAFTGCTVDDEPDVIENNYTFISEAFELSNVDFIADNNGNYEILHQFDNQLYPSDVVLVYRLSDASTTGNDVWEPIPRTVYLEGTDELDYDFNFTRRDVVIYMSANFDLQFAPAFTQNQVFRVVIVPAEDPVLGRINYNDYNAVAERYGITDANIKKISR